MLTVQWLFKVSRAKGGNNGLDKNAGLDKTSEFQLFFFFGRSSSLRGLSLSTCLMWVQRLWLNGKRGKCLSSNCHKHCALALTLIITLEDCVYWPLADTQHLSRSKYFVSVVLMSHLNPLVSEFALTWTLTHLSPFILSQSVCLKSYSIFTLSDSECCSLFCISS